jgi:tRNA U34 2-thiouridine synthase MnmA/TrmU
MFFNCSANDIFSVKEFFFVFGLVKIFGDISCFAKGFGNNKVIIGENEDLFTKRVKACDFNYMAVASMKPGDRYKAKIRYAHKGDWCKVISATENMVEIEFDEPVRAITPGQALVMYDGEYVAGGGTIICH